MIFLKTNTNVCNVQSPSRSSKDPSPDGRKTLNPIGRPPLPPKRKPGTTSPKRGGLSGPERGLSLRLSPSPSPTRIDIDSIGVPLGLPSPELKSDKQPTARSPSIKLTGQLSFLFLINLCFHAKFCYHPKQCFIYNWFSLNK